LSIQTSVFNVFKYYRASSLPGGLLNLLVGFWRQ